MVVFLELLRSIAGPGAPFKGLLDVTTFLVVVVVGFLLDAVIGFEEVFLITFFLVFIGEEDFLVVLVVEACPEVFAFVFALVLLALLDVDIVICLIEVDGLDTRRIEEAALARVSSRLIIGMRSSPKQRQAFMISFEVNCERLLGSTKVLSASQKVSLLHKAALTHRAIVGKTRLDPLRSPVT